MSNYIPQSKTNFNLKTVLQVDCDFVSLCKLQSIVAVVAAINWEIRCSPCQTGSLIKSFRNKKSVNVQ